MAVPVSTTTGFRASVLPMVLALVLACCLPAPGFALGVADQAAPPVAAVATPPPITPAVVISRVEALAGRLDDIEALLASPDPVVAGSEARLGPLVAEATALLAAGNDTDARTLSLLDLRAQYQDLVRVGDQLDAVRGRLQPSVASIEPLRAALKDDLAFLAEVQKADVARDLPQALKEQIPPLAARGNRALAGLRDRLNGPVALLESIGRLRGRVEARATGLKASIDQRARDYLTLTAPPLWTTVQADHEPVGVIVTRDAGQLAASATEFARSNASQIALFLFVFVALLVGAGQLSRAGRRRMVGSDAQPGLKLVERHPYLVVTLIWLLLGPEWVLPDLPFGLAMARAALALGALWVLVPAYIAPASVGPVRGLLVITLMVVLERALLGDGFYGRILSIVLAGFAILLFRRITPRQDDRILAGFTNGFCRAAPSLLAIGILAEVVGAETLGGEIVGGVLFLAALLTAFLMADVLLRELLDLLVAGPAARWSRAVRRHPDLVQRRVGFILRVLLVIAFVVQAPKALFFLGPVWEGIGNVLAAPVAIGAINLSLADIIRFILGVVLAIYLARTIRFLLQEDVLDRLPMSRGTSSTISRLAYYGALIAGLLFAFAAAGLELTQLTLVVSALGVGIGFGLQTVVNNFVSGLIIAFEHPFREGDLIQVGTVTGRVEEIGLRASRIRGPEGAELIVPNGNLISGELTNWTLTDRARRIEISVGVGYDSDPREVQELLRGAVAGQPNVATHPPPLVSFRAFGPSSLEFALFLWTGDIDDRLEVESESRVRVLTALRKAGIEIPFPRLDVALRQASDPAPLPATGPAAPPVAG